MVTWEHQVRPHPDVVDTELEGQEMVLLHLKSMRYYTLNPTGTRIWQGLKRDLTLRQISQRLQEEFVIEAERADSSVLTLVDELYQNELVQSLDREKSGDRSQARIGL